MLTVCILVNGHPIMARSATNTGRVCKLGKHIYDVDDGSRIYHLREDGAVALAIEMLKTINLFPTIYDTQPDLPFLVAEFLPGL